MRRILAAKYAFPEGVSPAFKDVVRRFLSVNAVHRLGSLKGGVKDVKLHPWFKSTDWYVYFNHRIGISLTSRVFCC